MDPDRTEPPWRSGNNHGFCVTGGPPPIVSEPTPSPRLWATPPGATPPGLCEHTMGVDCQPSKPELSTWPGIGTFYLAPTEPAWVRHTWAAAIGIRSRRKKVTTAAKRAAP